MAAHRSSRLVLSIALILLALMATLGLVFLQPQAIARAALSAAGPTNTITRTSMPGAEFTGSPLSGIAPLTVQFTHTSNSSLLSSCTWTFGDGTSQTTQPIGFSMCPAVSHTYVSAGSYTVSLRVVGTTSVFTNTLTKPNYIQVGGAPTLTPTRTNTLTPCESAVYTLVGRVYDAANSQGIANATVQTTTMIDAAPNTTTNADGSYTLAILNPYHGCNVIGLSAWADGYLQSSIQVTYQELMAQPHRDFALVRSGTPTRTPTPSNLMPDLVVSSITYVGSSPACANSPRDNVVVTNIGNASAGPFMVSFTNNGAAQPSQPVNGLAPGQSVTLSFTAGSNVTAQADSTTIIAESNELNNSLSAQLPVPTQAHTCTPTSGVTLTPTRTATATRTITPTRTLTPSAGACSPVNATIASPFIQDGAGTFCWQASTIANYINSYNMTSLTVNGTNFTNLWAAPASLPAKINGFWYIKYIGDFPWSHFEAK